MARSLLNKPSQTGPVSTSGKGPTDQELLGRLLEGAWRDDLFDDIGDTSDLSARLFDVAMESLRRTNETASRMVEESASFRRDFDAWLATHARTQSETRAMIEDLVNAG